MSKPVLSYLGETKLALGPVENVEGHPWRGAEADGIVWLVLDCADTSTNTISEVVLEGLIMSFKFNYQSFSHINH